MAACDGVGTSGIVRTRRSVWWQFRRLKVAGGGGAATGNYRRRVEASGGAWRVSECFLEDRPTGSDGYFRYERSGVGGESRNRDLRVCLDVFQILGFRRPVGWFGADFWCFGISFGSEILGICG